MSHAFYNAQWQRAMEQLAAQIDIENPKVQLNDNGKPVAVQAHERTRTANRKGTRQRADRRERRKPNERLWATG